MAASGALAPANQSMGKHKRVSPSVFPLVRERPTAVRNTVKGELNRVNSVQRYLLEEFVEEFHERRLNRRDLLRRATLIMGGVAAAVAALRTTEHALAMGSPPAQPAGTRPGALSAPVARFQSGTRTMPPPVAGPDPVIAPDDPAIVAETVSFSGPESDLSGYLARPVDADPAATRSVVIIHQNQGLTDLERDIARRFAVEGYNGLAIDLLSRVGGTDQFANDRAGATGAVGRLGPDAPAADAAAAVAYLAAAAFGNGIVGMTGYCYGGGVVWRTGVRVPDLRAIVPYYGSNPPLGEVSNLRAAALGIYAQLDVRLTSGSDALATALADVGAVWEFWVAENANHAFFDNRREDSYNATAAGEAWVRTLTWFDRFLRGIDASHE